MESIELLNRRLVIYHGLDVNISKPTWRIVWSTDEREKRSGTFIKETESGIFLGYETGIREVPKYFMDPNKWVLEKLTPNVNNPELPDKYSYEPVWVFKEGLYPEWWAVEHLIKCWQFATSSKETQSDADYKERRAIEREQVEFLDYLKGEARPFHGKLSDHEAIVVPNKRFGE